MPFKRDIMGKELLIKIDNAIENCTEQLVNDAITLININSVKGDAEKGAPFGKGPRAVLDKVLEMGANNGFYCTDYGVGVVSLATKNTQPDVGIWLHGDVVSVGDGWSFRLLTLPYTKIAL